MYFDDMKELNEANYALFNISKKDNYRTVAKNNMNRLNKILLNRNKLYNILKILTVKHIEKNKKNRKNPQIIQLTYLLNYDIEFYKI